MKEVKEFKEIEPEKLEYYFDMTLTDGHTSQIKIIKEMGEYVLIGDDRQHFSKSELKFIVSKISELNNKIYQRSMIEDCDDDDESNEQ